MPAPKGNKFASKDKTLSSHIPAVRVERQFKARAVRVSQPRKLAEFVRWCINRTINDRSAIAAWERYKSLNRKTEWTSRE